jgi:hypothetical protein
MSTDWSRWVASCRPRVSRIQSFGDTLVSLSFRFAVSTNNHHVAESAKQGDTISFQSLMAAQACYIDWAGPTPRATFAPRSFCLGGAYGESTKKCLVSVHTCSVQTKVWIYSKKNIFGRKSEIFCTPCSLVLSPLTSPVHHSIARSGNNTFILMLLMLYQVPTLRWNLAQDVNRNFPNLYS